MGPEDLEPYSGFGEAVVAVAADGRQGINHRQSLVFQSSLHLCFHSKRKQGPCARQLQTVVERFPWTTQNDKVHGGAVFEISEMLVTKLLSMYHAFSSKDIQILMNVTILENIMALAKNINVELLCTHANLPLI